MITPLMLTFPCLITFGATRFCASLIPFMALAAAVPVSQLFRRYLPKDVLQEDNNE